MSGFNIGKHCCHGSLSDMCISSCSFRTLLVWFSTIDHLPLCIAQACWTNCVPWSGVAAAERCPGKPGALGGPCVRDSWCQAAASARRAISSRRWSPHLRSGRQAFYCQARVWLWKHIRCQRNSTGADPSRSSPGVECARGCAGLAETAFSITRLALASPPR